VGLESGLFMHNPSYLIRSRHNVYYYRRPLLPAFIRPGKTTHIKLSLKTRCPKEALQLAQAIEYHAVTIMHMEGANQMEHGEILELLREYFYELIDQKKAHIHKFGPLPKQDVWDLIEQRDHAEEAIEAERDEIIPGESLRPMLMPILKRFQINMPEDSDEYQTLQSRFKYAYKGYCEKILSHNQKQLDFPFTTKPSYLKMLAQEKAAKPEHHLRHITEQYIRETKHTWGIRAEEERRDCLNVLMEILGQHFAVQGMDYATARKVKETLIKLPVNRNKNKATRDLPLMQQIEVEAVKRLSIASVNKYLTCYSGLCKWAKKNGYMEDNPFEGMLLKEQQGKKREMFTSAEAQTIISELDKRKKAGTLAEYRYWGALIALFTGARLNEIASLTPDDVKQEKGIWYFDINDETEQKRLKTDAAKRHVPVHSALLDRGLLAYIEQVRKMPEAGLRLLHELTYNEKEGWGRKLNRWFNETLLPELGLKRPKTSYHSIRHTVTTTMRRAKVDNHIVRALVGHEPDGVTEEVYHHGYELPVLQEAVETINYTVI
jgi:integrase